MERFLVSCWNCLSQYDAYSASWCGHSNPTTVCPFCFKCFCDSSEEYKQHFFSQCPEELLRLRPDSPQPHPRRIGEILVEAGKISPQQLAEALDQQSKLKKKLGEILVVMSLLTRNELELYLLNQKDFSEIQLERIELDPSLLHLIGEDFCVSNCIVPIEVQHLPEGQILRLAFSEVADLEKVQKAPELQGYKIIPYLAKRGEIELILERIRADGTRSQVQAGKKLQWYARALNRMIADALQSSASDIYFLSQSGQLQVSARSGDLVSPIALPEVDALDFFARVKQLVGVRPDIPGNSQRLWLSVGEKFQQYRVRLHYYTGVNQENIRLHIINTDDLSQKVNGLSLSAEELDMLELGLRAWNGVFLVIAPNFHHSQETLYALKNSLSGDKVATVETEVLLRDGHHYQVEIEGPEVRLDLYYRLLSFKPAAMLLFDFFQKQYDPKYLEFAQMGKLFLEANGYSYAEVFERFFEDYEVPFDFFRQHLRLVLLQRLVSVLCPHCKEAGARSARQLFADMDLRRDFPVFQEKGCEKCRFTGIDHQEVFYELLALQEGECLNWQKEDLQKLPKMIMEKGLATISQKVLQRLLRGDVSYNEYRRFF